MTERSALSYDEREVLCRALDGARDQIVATVMAAMYRNPFWEARYGERGRRHGHADNQYHLDYLVSSIRTNTPGVLTDYYRWLQSVLTSRGMSSLHIRQNMDQMAAALQVHLPDLWPQIEPYYRAGYDGLRYDHPACRALAAQEGAIADATTGRMFASTPLWEEQFGARGRELCRQDNLYHLSYLQDSVGGDLPLAFEAYAGWLSGFLGGLGITAAHLAADLALLSEELDRSLSEEAGRPFLTLLAPVVMSLASNVGEGEQ